MFSNSYSSLEEAWGIDPTTKKTKSSKRSKTQRDPICELYELGVGSSPSRAYTEMDVMNAIGPATRPSASMMQQREPELDDPVDVIAPSVQKQAKPAPMPVSEDDDDMSEFIGYIDKRVSEQRKTAEQAVLPYADVGLYMISGVILIFMMEQFIKIGMAMRGY